MKRRKRKNKRRNSRTTKPIHATRNRLNLDIFGICFLFGNLYAISLERPPFVLIMAIGLRCRPYRCGDRPNDRREKKREKKDTRNVHAKDETCIKIALIHRYHCMQSTLNGQSVRHTCRVRPQDLSTCVHCANAPVNRRYRRYGIDNTSLHVYILRFQNERTMPSVRRFNATFAENNFHFYLLT